MDQFPSSVDVPTDAMVDALFDAWMDPSMDELVYASYWMNRWTNWWMHQWKHNVNKIWFVIICYEDQWVNQNYFTDCSQPWKQVINIINIMDMYISNGQYNLCWNSLKIETNKFYNWQWQEVGFWTTYQVWGHQNAGVTFETAINQVHK